MLACYRSRAATAALWTVPRLLCEPLGSSSPKESRGVGLARLPELDALVDGGLELGDERLQAGLLVVAKLAEVMNLLRA